MEEGGRNTDMASPSNSCSVGLLPQFHCTLCQDVFIDPVSSSCGHNFCKACLTGYWDGKDTCQCPLCEKRFEGPLDLSVNEFLAQMIQYYKDRALEAHKPETKIEEKDSCLQCQASRCDGRAESCSTGYLLVDPALDLKDRKCEEHDQPLEIFCSTDHTCICTECVEDGHGEHSTAPVEREWLNRREQLKILVLQVEKQILDRQKKMEEIKRQTRLSREDGEEDLKEGRQILEALKRSVEKCQAELQTVIEEKQKEVESRAQNFLEELEGEIGELKTTKTELKKLFSCQDHVQVLQSLPSQLAPSCLQDWNEIILHAHLSVGIVRSVLSQHERNLGEKLRMLMGTEYKKIACYANNVTLNPLTAQNYRVVSVDRKNVHYKGNPQSLSHCPDRFNSSSCVLGEQGFSSGRHYWEVQVEGKQSWRLGVVTGTIKEKWPKPPEPKNGFWLLHLKETKILTALDTSPVEFRLTSLLKKVGVYVDYEEGQISFYNVETKSALYSFSGQTITGELYLVLDPGVYDILPMGLTTVSQTIFVAPLCD